MSKDRPRRHFGRVRQLRSGRWQARYTGPDGVTRTAPYTFERDRDADNWLAAVQTDMSRGDWANPDAAKVKVIDYATGWVAEHDLSVRTVELYKGLLRNHIAPYLGEKTLDQISPAHIRKWRKGLASDGVGQVTIAKSYRLLHAVLTTAVSDRLIKFNPCNIKKAGKEDSSERPIATLEQVMNTADAIQPRYRLMVLLATFASLRFGEMVGLRRRDLDVDNSVVYVRRQTIQADNGEMFDDDPKSEAGKRPVDLPLFLIPEVQKHLREYVGKSATARVFVGPKGGLPRRSNFYTIWNKARVAGGMPDVHFHDLRHTGNTLAAETGATLKELMNRMGHNTTRAALIYLHTRERRGRIIADGIHNIVEQATTSRPLERDEGEPACADTTADQDGHAAGTGLENQTTQEALNDREEGR